MEGGSLDSLTLVLDTNAVLDWLLFRDKGLARVGAAIESGAATAFTSRPCLEELRRVLGYPEFKLDEEKQAALLEHYQEHVEVIDVTEDTDWAIVVPLCKDPDDQKFLALASQERAVLVTKDKLLLQLARRVAKAGRFLILRPDQLVERHLA